jgi:hypothetical protein
VRNSFERAISQLANRIAGVAPLTRELLTTLEPADIVLEGVPAVIGQDAEAARRCRKPCPGCGQEIALAPKYLGRRVQCQRCQHQFCFDWGEMADGD